MSIETSLVILVDKDTMVSIKTPEVSINKKSPRLGAFKKVATTYSPRFNLVPSALVGLTSLFGMGRGGPHRYSHRNIVKVLVEILYTKSFRVISTAQL